MAHLCAKKDQEVEHNPTPGKTPRSESGFPDKILTPVRHLVRIESGSGLILTPIGLVRVNFNPILVQVNSNPNKHTLSGFDFNPIFCPGQF